MCTSSKATFLPLNAQQIQLYRHVLNDKSTIRTQRRLNHLLPDRPVKKSISYSCQIQMYQLSRLLHDYHRDLYSHLEQQEIGPSLYATPWFLTAFASHFPLGFVARVFGKL